MDDAEGESDCPAVAAPPNPSREAAELLDRNQRSARRWNQAWLPPFLGGTALGAVGAVITPGSIGSRLGFGVACFVAGAVGVLRLGGGRDV